MNVSPFFQAKLKIVRASTAHVETELALALCAPLEIRKDPYYISWWHMEMALLRDLLVEDAAERHADPIIGELWRYDTGGRCPIDEILQTAVCSMIIKQGQQPTLIAGMRRQVEELRSHPLRDLADLRLNETVLLDILSPTTPQLQPETSLPPHEHTTSISPKHEQTPTPDPSQPDLPAQPDPPPKLEQIDGYETIVAEKERDSSPLKEDPDPGFIDDPKVTFDAGGPWLKVEKFEEYDSGS